MIKYSVIIPTHNRSESLSDTIKSLVSQTSPPNVYEIIIMDDGSSDDTKKTVIELKSKFPLHNIQYHYQSNKGSACAKNEAVKKSKGPILLFTDDDCIVPNDWIEKIGEGYKKYPEVAGVTGPYTPPADEKRFFQKYRHLKNILSDLSYSNQEKIIDSAFPYVGLIPNVSYKKDIFEKTGGFDEKIPLFASPDLRYRITFVEKQKILYIPTTVIHNCTLNFRKYAKKLFILGQNRYYFSKKYFKNGKNPFFRYSILTVPKKVLSEIYYIQKTKKLGFADTASMLNFLLVENILLSCGWLSKKRKNS